MARSLRRQKIILKRAIEEAVAKGIYVQDKENPRLYHLGKPFEDKYETPVKNFKSITLTRSHSFGSNTDYFPLFVSRGWN